MTSFASGLEAVLPGLPAIFQPFYAEDHLPGCAWGVIHRGELIHSDSLGVIEPGRAGAPGPDTVYGIASMTKSFTALAVLLLRDAGKLHLDAPAAAYVPELRGLAYPTHDSAPISVRDLLTMSAGWPEDNPWGDRQVDRPDAELAQILAGGVSFSNPPGVTFEYSNLGYMVLGRIISLVSEERSLDFITRHILQPLGMRDTVWSPAHVPILRLARAWRWPDDADRTDGPSGGWQPEPMPPSAGDAACFGGLLSSVRDLARWVALMLSAWPPRDEPDGPEAGAIVRRATLRELQQAWRRYPPSDEPPPLGQPVRWSSGGYGYGLSASQTGDLLVVSHAGGLPGYGSHMCWAPDYDLGVVALGNVTYAPMRPAATKALEHLLRAGSVPRRTVRPAPALPAAQASVNRLLERWDDAEAEALFAQNFFLDDTRASWQRAFDRVRATHGTLTPAGDLKPENALRGTWRMAGERGWCDVYLTLSPTVPPRVQELTLDSVLPPGPALAAALDALARLTGKAAGGKPTRREVNRLFSGDVDRGAADDVLRVAGILCGPCTVGAVLAGDGETVATVMLEGPKGKVQAEVRFDPATQRLTDMTLRQV